MRLAAAACALAVVVFLAIFGAVLAQKASAPSPVVTAAAPAAPAPAPAKSTKPAAVVTEVNPATTVGAGASPTTVAQGTPAVTGTVAAPPAGPAFAPVAPPAPAAPRPTAASACANPNALGIARTVEIDTTGGPGFGFEHFKMHDFLQPMEVVLTFDDGPWPHNTPEVLAALANHCTKALFFAIGKHSMWEPGLLKQVAAAGHAVGSHTWSHIDLVKLMKKNPDEAKAEIEKGISAVHWALGQYPMAPFFRFPALAHPAEMVSYLGERNVAIFSADFDSQDFKIHKPDAVIASVMTKLKRNGDKGIILMHDFQRGTADAMPKLLDTLKAGGYKVVFMKPRTSLASLPQYDEMVMKDVKLPTVSGRPTSSVVRTVDQ
jgi:peptidoglycan/xylan/chitin deacetylase (PgdA/CDA1 family)